MSQSTAEKSESNRWFAAAIVCVALVVGIAMGVSIPASWLPSYVTGIVAVEAEAEEADDAEASAMFDVSLAAQQTYNVTFSTVAEQTRDFVQTSHLPAFVIERPATSNLKSSSRLSGVVRRVFVQVGQSVRENDPLVELDLTGDELATAQTQLLTSIQQLKIANDEVKRLTAAAAEGGLARRSLLTQQYEQRRLQALAKTRRQELLVRGLSVSDVDRIVETEQLIRSVILRVPSDIRPDDRLTPDFTSQSKSATLVTHSSVDDWVYSIETLNVSPGSMLEAGESIGDLAFHESLLIEGQAYERDLPLLTRLLKDQSEIAVEFGPHDSHEVLGGLRVVSIDNHVDDETQTYPFYLRVQNSVLSENRIGDRRFRVWKFKPGQRGHVLLPEQTWSNRLVLPADAVAQDGIDHAIFRRIAVHDHFHGSEPPHAEFEKITVAVDYRDQNWVVVDDRDQLSSKQTIATSNADMLLRAMQDSSGGHGHHHDHDH